MHPFQPSGDTLWSPAKMNHCAAFSASYPEIAFKCIVIHVCVHRQGHTIHTLTCIKITCGAKGAPSTASAVSAQQRRWGRALRKRYLMTGASNKVSWHKDGMNLDLRHWSVILQHWLREINQVLKMERLWCIEETNFWELWRMWGYVKEQHLPFSATLQLVILLSLFLLVWKYGDRKRWALSHNCMGDQRHLSALHYFVVREGWNATLLPSYISPSGSLLEEGSIHRAVWPPLAQVSLEGQGLHRQAWKAGKQKSWGGYQERNWLRREWEIRGKAESSCVCLGRHWWHRVDLPAAK